MLKVCTNIFVPLLVVAGAAAACGDDPTMSPRDAELVVLSGDSVTGEWFLSGVSTVTPASIRSVAIEALRNRTAQKAAETQTDDLGPSWGDIIVAPEYGRAFINAINADAMIVVRLDDLSVEQIYEFNWGDRPVHIFRPLGGSEIWTHLDGKGSFFVVDVESLSVLNGLQNLVSGTSTTVNTGHGKLLYALGLGSTYYATNTSEPSAFVIDGVSRRKLQRLEVCGIGGTHDKAYLPGPDLVALQCTRGQGYAFVNPDDQTVVADRVELSGSITHSPGYKYTLAIRTSSVTDIQVWDASDTQTNGYDIDWSVHLGSGASARGTHFRKTSGDEWEAWIPQSSGTQVGILNLDTRMMRRIEVGVLTAPPGAAHFSRRAAFVPGAFVTPADSGLMFVDVDTLQVTQGPTVPGVVARFGYAKE